MSRVPEARIEVNGSVGDVTPKYNAIYKWVTTTHLLTSWDILATSHFRVAEAQKGYSKKGVEEFNFCLFSERVMEALILKVCCSP